MKLIDYIYHGTKDDDWFFSINSLKNVNLIVGDTATGKTRFLSTIFNLGRSAVSADIDKRGKWEATFSIGDEEYRWYFATDFGTQNKIVVKEDRLYRLVQEGSKEAIVERDEENFIYNSKPLPKLSQNVSSISLLKNEERIGKIFQGFGSILRRNFYDDELQKNYAVETPSPGLLERFRSEKSNLALFHSNLGVNLKLHVLHEVYPEKYSLVRKSFLDIFGFIEDVKIIDFNELHIRQQLPLPTPVFCAKERGTENYVESIQVSSGVQKVLLLLLDTVLLPEGGIFLIDEYENSLGLSAINFLPDYLLSSEFKNQFFITSHHPYIINNIPIENWIVFHRRGLQVKVKTGSELKEKFGKSRQQYFLQLINDPFYREGIE